MRTLPAGTRFLIRVHSCPFAVESLVLSAACLAVAFWFSIAGCSLAKADSSAVGIFHAGDLLLALAELDQRVEKLLSTMFVTIEMHEVSGIRNCDQTFDRCMHQVSY
jgi:hypothetical protein